MEALFEGFQHAEPPPHFVLMGNFCSSPITHGTYVGLLAVVLRARSFFCRTRACVGTVVVSAFADVLGMHVADMEGFAKHPVRFCAEVQTEARFLMIK